MNLLCPEKSAACRNRFGIEEWPTVEQVLVEANRAAGFALEFKALDSRRIEDRKRSDSLRREVLEWSRERIVRDCRYFVSELLHDYIDPSTKRLSDTLDTGGEVCFFRRTFTDQVEVPLVDRAVDVEGFGPDDGSWLLIVGGEVIFQASGRDDPNWEPPTFTPRNFLNAYAAVHFAVSTFQALPRLGFDDQAYSEQLKKLLEVLCEGMKPAFRIDHSKLCDTPAWKCSRDGVRLNVCVAIERDLRNATRETQQRMLQGLDPEYRQWAQQAYEVFRQLPPESQFFTTVSDLMEIDVKYARSLAKIGAHIAGEPLEPQRGGSRRKSR